MSTSDAPRRSEQSMLATCSPESKRRQIGTTR